MIGPLRSHHLRVINWISQIPNTMVAQKMISMIR